MKVLNGKKGKDENDSKKIKQYALFSSIALLCIIIIVFIIMFSQKEIAVDSVVLDLDNYEKIAVNLVNDLCTSSSLDYSSIKCIEVRKHNKDNVIKADDYYITFIKNGKKDIALYTDYTAESSRILYICKFSDSKVSNSNVELQSFIYIRDKDSFTELDTDKIINYIMKNK